MEFKFKSCDYELIYRKGTLHGNADSLSRMPILNVNELTAQMVNLAHHLMRLQKKIRMISHHRS